MCNVVNKRAHLEIVVRSDANSNVCRSMAAKLSLLLYLSVLVLRSLDLSSLSTVLVSRPNLSTGWKGVKGDLP